jgi:hypothetical protein
MDDDDDDLHDDAPVISSNPHVTNGPPLATGTFRAANLDEFVELVSHIVPLGYFNPADDARYPLDAIKQEGVPRYKTIDFTNDGGAVLGTVHKTVTRYWDMSLPLLDSNVMTLPLRERGQILPDTIRQTMATQKRVPLAWLYYIIDGCVSGNILQNTGVVLVPTLPGEIPDTVYGTTYP